MHVQHDETQGNDTDNACCGNAKAAETARKAAALQDEPQQEGRAYKALLWTGLLAGCSHIFCCVLPGIFSILALLSGFGIIVTLPGWLENLHEAMHDWELPVIAFSGIIVVIGWGAYIYSRMNDCHNHGCEHSTCQPRKQRVGRVLLLASALFLVNIAVYFGVHAHGEDTHDHHGHEQHDEHGDN